MALVAAAVLPHPPLLISDVAAGAASELDGLRASCLDALLQVLTDTREDTEVLLVGGGPERSTFSVGSEGTMRGFGVPVDVRLTGRAPSERESDRSARMPMSLTVGAWLLRQLDPRVTEGLAVRAESVPFDVDAVSAQAVGRELAASRRDVVMVCMGDGASSLSVNAPGYMVPGAREWQDALTSAIEKADVDALGALTREDGDRYGAAGRAAWQVLAGAAEGASWESELLHEDDRYGVAYLVARWTRLSGSA